MDADEFVWHNITLNELNLQKKEIQEKINDINDFFFQYSAAATEIFEEEILKLSHFYEYEEATLQAIPEVESHIMLLQGWIPKRLEKNLLSFLTERDIIHIAEDPKPAEVVPVSLRNNAFAQKFEVISKMYMLPYYQELDLTPFFAPFYMMFFGICSGDTGYGIILFLIGFLLKLKFKNPALKIYFTLLQFLGLGAVIMGFVMGSFFAVDLKQVEWLEPSILIKNPNQIFNFALILGVIQILWGVLLNAVKQIKLDGVKNGLASLGTLVFLLCLVIVGSEIMGANPGVLKNYAKYGIYLGLFFIFFFNSPGKSIIMNFANGFWLIFNIVTGFFGDILSYIRLFALGVSSGILGIVVNTMAKQFGAVPIIGPVIFILFIVLGHGLNIALSSLGAVVHPLRLTFVEFFKNAGFTGPGPEYKPFGNIK